MRLKLTANLPCCWQKHPKAKGINIVLEHDVPLGKSRLKAKLLVFKSRRDMSAFWREVLGQPMSGSYFAGVSSLIEEHGIIDRNGKTVQRWLTADKRYFCVMGFLRKHLLTEILAHESVHAGFAYAKRVKRSPWDAKAEDFDEEAICYPSGIIAANVNQILHDRGMYHK